MATIKYKDENGQWQEIAVVGDSTEVIDNLESDSTTAALSANQGRVLKEMIEELPSGGTGGGLELRELKIGDAEDKEYNLETLRLMQENKALPAIDLGDGILSPLAYYGGGMFDITLPAGDGIEVKMTFTMAEDGSIEVAQEVLAPSVLVDSEAVKKWINNSSALAGLYLHEPAYVMHNNQFCLIDCSKATISDGLKKQIAQFNYDNKRFERVYNANTGEEISTTEIPIGGGVTEQKVEEMIAASVGDIKTLIVAINGEEV